MAVGCLAVGIYWEKANAAAMAAKIARMGMWMWSNRRCVNLFLFAHQKAIHFQKKVGKYHLPTLLVTGYTLNFSIYVARALRRCQANERAVFTVGLLSERLRANASFKPTWFKRSLMCMTANLIFLNPFCIKTKRIRPAAQSGILNSGSEHKQCHTYDYAALIVPTR